MSAENNNAAEQDAMAAEWAAALAESKPGGAVEAATEVQPDDIDRAIEDLLGDDTTDRPHED